MFTSVLGCIVLLCSERDQNNCSKCGKIKYWKKRFKLFVISCLISCWQLVGSYVCLQPVAVHVLIGNRNFALLQWRFSVHSNRCKCRLEADIFILTFWVLYLKSSCRMLLFVQTSSHFSWLKPMSSGGNDTTIKFLHTYWWSCLYRMQAQ